MQRAQGLREAADLLDKAARALADGNRELADLLFSSAEILTGTAAVAEIAGMFREGAPPLVDTPLVKVPDTGPAPVALGNSDDEDAEEAKAQPPAPEPKAPVRGSLEGNVLVGGKVPAGALAVITLEPSSGKWKPRTPKQRLMEQRDRQFAPRLLVISTGSTVSFPNYDKVFHNVFSTTGQMPFDLGIYKEGDARSVTFKEEGIYRVGCNLHANMSAHIAVVSQPTTWSPRPTARSASAAWRRASTR
ncbi:MAG: plastocyanin/azurin family copper-binding protein [Kofleriaceae bacterium]